MPRKVQGPPPGEVRRYVPKAYGNRDEAEPVVLWIRAPTEAEKRRIDAGRSPVRIVTDDAGEMRRTDDGDLEMDLNMRAIVDTQEYAVSLCVERVDNYLGASGDAITNGAELAEHGEKDFVAEAYLEIKHAHSLSEETVKDSSGSCTSTPPETSGSGTAASASSKGRPAGATATGQQTTQTFDTSPKTA